MTIFEMPLIALAGGIGSVCRLLFAQWFGKLPWGILAANTIASFIAGFAEFSIPDHPLANVIVVVGFCGGLSTFSTFSAQTVEYFKTKQVLRGVINILLNFLLPALAVIGAAIMVNALLK